MTAREKPRSSLVRRLIWIAAAWIAAALVATGLVLTAFFHQAALSRFEAGLADLADGLLAGSSIAPDGHVVAPTLIDAKALRVYSGRYWQIAEATDAGRGVNALMRSRSLFDAVLAAPPKGTAALTAKPTFYDSEGPQGEPLRVAAVAATLPGRTTPLIFMVAEDRSPVDEDATRFATLAWLALLLLGGGLMLAVFVQVRVGLKPLFALGREIGEVRKGKVQRLAGDYPQEVEPLATELNALLDHNQEVVERQRTHVGNLAHALKTPLAVMLTEAGAERSPLAEVVRRQSEIMRGQVEHHLRRARAAARSQAMGERTLVEPVLDELATLLEKVFQDKGVEIDWIAPETVCFRGEKQDLQEIAGNVLENACKWCKGKVRARVTEADHRLRLTVEDDGPGLPPEAREQMLKRGARLDESAPGSGLGLSIVDELVRAYGGTIRLDEAAMGGLKVEIELPTAEN
ncbi:MAG TPA: ATP-binding protein [Caulobacteraceae bacterium]|nr:ATP-binding protein [Caulobacteraceae bacterium]